MFIVFFCIYKINTQLANNNYNSIYYFNFVQSQLLKIIVRQWQTFGPLIVHSFLMADFNILFNNVLLKLQNQLVD